MTLQGSSTVSVNNTTRQMIICIPSKIATDSQFPLKAGDVVEIRFLPWMKALVISKINEK